jgi:enoyl-CoA hydratase
MQAAFEHVGYRVASGIATITLDRPEKLNAINTAMRRGLAAAVAQVRQDSGVRAVVVTGAGTRAFCVGADVTEFAGRTPMEQRAIDLAAPRIFEELEALDRPVICAINGLALGGGCELALACDVRVACETAVIGLVEVHHGIIPGGGGTQRLPRLVGLGRALRMVLTGDPVTAAEALAAGLVDDVVPLERVVPAAQELAARMARHSPMALAAAKEAVRATTQLSLAEGLRREIDLFALCLTADETQRRLAEFKTGRRPDLGAVGRSHGKS